MFVYTLNIKNVSL